MMQKLRLLVSRCVIALVNDAAKMQEVQAELLDDEARASCERFQNYGFTSVPHPGAEGIGLAVGGVRSHMVVVAVDDRRYRMKSLEEGEVALYTDEGDYVLLKRGRIIEVKAGSKVSVDAPLVETTGDLHVKGSITCDNQVSDQKGSMQGMRDTYNGHNNGPSTTTPPQQMT